MVERIKIPIGGLFGKRVKLNKERSYDKSCSAGVETSGLSGSDCYSPMVAGMQVYAIFQFDTQMPNFLT